ncbi:MAG: GGDEF domain-containing protein, partial [Ignavibacteriae bacterium]|nr:GGDEF domain-containing protein [Ignavibacteriota bacterium]
EYFEFCRYKAIYDQIRLISDTGMEVIRVNYNNGNPEAVSEDMLQNKSNRYYFKKTLSLDCNGIFVSSLDLNIEKEKIEIPFKPMMRFGISLCDKMNNKYAIIVLNYLGVNFLNLIKTTNSNMMLLNSDSYWLYSPNSEDTWGFIIKERENRKFSSDFPDEWEKIKSSSEDQFHSDNGLFTFSTINPLKEIKESDYSSGSLINKICNSYECSDAYWKIVSYVPQKILFSKTRDILLKFLILAIITFLLTSIPAWFITKAIVKRRLQQLKLYESANFDRLTSLPNRTLFLETLNIIHHQSKRYNHNYALIFIDLNGFKEINDTLGHNAGDQVLIEVGRRLSECIRKSDMAARLGGDEFTIILPFISSLEDAKKVAQKISMAISDPINLKHCKRQISASTGISFYPDDGDETDILLRIADNNMYEMKRETKKV